MSRAPRIAHRALALDVAAFCRDRATLSGRWPLAGLPRLAAAVSETGGAVGDAAADWQAGGSQLPVRAGRAQCLIELQVDTCLILECQRCLQAMQVPLQVRGRFRFVDDEDEAARLDEELEDDVLALTPRLDLRELVEDELLLAVPLVPRHEACPDLPSALAAAAPGPGDPVTRDEHPFAVLAALAKARGSEG